MKKVKKILAVLLTAAMILGMNLSVLATEPAPQATTGSISISNPMKDQEYAIYLMFELESANNDAYSYRVTEDWKEFVNSDSTGKEYLELYNNDEYVRIKDGGEENTYDPLELNDTQKAELAKAAITYAKRNAIDPTATLPIEKDGSTSYTVSGLTLGYYAVDSSAGTLCSLTTVNPNAPVREKNLQPTVDKMVLEDVNNNGEVDDADTWGHVNDDESGDTIYYKTIITAQAGAHNYILHDRMGEGLTLNKDSIKVTVGDSTLTGYFVDGVVNKELESDEKYAEKGSYYVLYDHASEETSTEVCDFEIHFTEAYLATLKEETEIIVTYNAELNEQAKIYEEGNINATKLQYGDENYTEVIKTYTYTYMFDVIKTDDKNNVISGATFELYRADANGTKDLNINENETVKVEATAVKLISKGNETYMVADLAESDNRAVTSFKAGDVTIKGLDVGTYYLLETQAPTGYNKLDYAIKVEFERDETTKHSSNNVGTTLEGKYLGEGGIQVINNTGTLLPETGGTGRTILYTAGSIFTVAAIVIIVTKKRMRHEK